jgi:uncharacterized protein (TIGR02646 family)
MIKINKDLDDIPESLLVSMTNSTHLARLDVIGNGSYYKEKTYDKLYKKDDIKDKLNSYYHHKCAYCEQRVEQIHVEHYRPKKEKGYDSYAYYWIGFSWDNLLVSCPTCNSKKGNKFRIRNNRVSFVQNVTNINGINCLSSGYDLTEEPFIVNPEVTDPNNYIHFSIDGKMTSEDENFKYTIDEVCKLSRRDLNDQRRKLISDFENNLRAELKRCLNIDEKKIVVGIFIRKWICDSKDYLNPFLAFRNYAIRENWIKNIILEVIN